jgi:hypothetical protein
LRDNQKQKAPQVASQRVMSPSCFIRVHHSGGGHMQDMSHLIRGLALVGLVSLGAPVVGCTIVEDDDEPDVRLEADDLEDDEDVEVEVED